MKATFSTIKFAIVVLCLSLSGTFAQSIYTYSGISYDSSSNTVESYSYTQPDYSTGLYYQARVSASIMDDDGNSITSGVGTPIQSGGPAVLTLQVTGNGCGYYWVTADHTTEVEYYLYDEGGYSDPYNYEYFEGGETYWSSFEYVGPGPAKIVNYQSFLLLGSTEKATTGNCEICAYPANFRQDPNHPPQALDNGVLHFDYLWDSSDSVSPNDRAKTIHHLFDCQVYEHVEYPPPYKYFINDPNKTNPQYVPASPPYTPLAFGAKFNHPEPYGIQGWDGSSTDNHHIFGTATIFDLPQFRTPYVEDDINVTQYYRAKCPCKDNNQEYDLMGPLTINRSVWGVDPGRWYHTVSKSGYHSSFHLPL